MSKNKKEHRKGYLTAKLVFFDYGWRDNIVYNAMAKQHEKEKGLAMVERLKNLFNINLFDEEEFRKKMIQMQVEAFTPTEYPKERELVKWTRDEKGKIVSPFSKKDKKEIVKNE
ncbi:hypothetical protein LCGC14_1459530 [marine sediment metagenome]|uniref:Uncharacterized protein n=1 Tax=marine sediment metagenome TaxID=412755 RepID=A0A0F9JG19_9ZZZZ